MRNLRWRSLFYPSRWLVALLLQRGREQRQDLCQHHRYGVPDPGPFASAVATTAPSAAARTTGAPRTAATTSVATLSATTALTYATSSRNPTFSA